MKFEKLIYCILFIFVTSCSSSKLKYEYEEKVISRIDDFSSRPEWLKESEPFKITNGSVLAIGQTSTDGDARTEVAFRVSDNNAKHLVASAIEQKLDFIFQNAEEGLAKDQSQIKYIGSETSKLTTSSIRIGKRYWEKVAIMDESGKQKILVKYFSEIEMPENEFKSAIIESLKQVQNKNGITKNFAKQVDEQWDKITK